MKYISFYTLVYLFICTSCSCYAQKLIRNTGDALKLEQNKQSFINKPFSTLLEQIVPDIKSVYAEGRRGEGYPGFFIIKFVDAEDQKKFARSKKVPLRITVFVKEKFIWDKSAKPVKDRENWTSDDIEKYKNLTIVDIRVYGDVNP